MKNNMIRCLSGAVLTALLLFMISSCKKVENGWATENSHARLFMPLTFDYYSLDKTSVGIEYAKVIGAAKYIFEVSDDSLQFTNIVQRRVILADTLTAYSTSTYATQTTYRTLFSGLYADSRYSVRMIAVNSDSSSATKYDTLTFRTPAENIITSLSGITTNGATVKWDNSDNLVSYLTVTATSDATSKNALADSVITDTEIANAAKTFSGLSAGTSYTLKIYYYDGQKLHVRGSVTFKTIGTAGSFIYNLSTTEDASAVLTTLLGQGHTNVTLSLTAAATYTISTLTIPTGITRLTIAGSDDLPTVNLGSVVSATTGGAFNLEGILFQSILLNGSATLFDLKTGTSITDALDFEGCTIENYTTVIKVNASTSVASITVNNCICYNIGGSSGPFIAVSGTNANVTKAIKFTNSTLIECKNQIVTIKTVVPDIEIINCTIYNNVNKFNQLFYGSAIPTQVIIDECIFGGTNAGTKFQPFSTKTALASSYGTDYITSDMTFYTDNTAGSVLTGINVLAISSTSLFTDPANWKFYIQTGVVFAGSGVAGDPRWW